MFDIQIFQFISDFIYQYNLPKSQPGQAGTKKEIQFKPLMRFDIKEAKPKTGGL